MTLQDDETVEELDGDGFEKLSKNKKQGLPTKRNGNTELPFSTQQRQQNDRIDSGKQTTGHSDYRSGCKRRSTGRDI